MSESDKPTFIMVPADLIALVGDGKLSKEAAWLYVVLLSHHNRTRRDDDVWPSRTVLAREIGLTKPQSVDKYLAELREAGLILSERRKRSSDMNTSSKHTLLLTVPRTGEEVEAQRARRAAIPQSGQRYPRQRTADVPHRGQELEEVELEELKDVEEMSRIPARFAPDDARHGESEDRKPKTDWWDDDPWATAKATSGASNPKPHEARTYENWHDTDRQLFRQLVGDVLVSIGGRGTWKKGKFTADSFYDAYRRKNEGEKRWPGKYLESITGAGESAVDDWLIDQGLERPDWK